MRETGSTGYKAKLVKELKRRYRGCVILSNNANYIQGIPDLLILYKDKWAILEVKAHAKAKRQPNQEWYVDEMNKMSFASFIYPENEEEVLNALHESFEPRRSTRIPVR